MSSNDPLREYLTDHLAGATAGTNLVKKIAAENEGSLLAEAMTGVAAEIEADRRTLERLISALGLERSLLKEAAGWVSEQLSRLRFADLVAGSRQLKLLLELETLGLGIEGKLSMWRALRTRAEPMPAGFDLDELIKRAEEQRATVDRHRLEAASLAFAGQRGDGS